MIFGGVLKWFKSPVLKTGRAWKRREGSKPSTSARGSGDLKMNDDVPARSMSNLLASPQKMCTSCLVHDIDDQVSVVGPFNNNEWLMKTKFPRRLRRLCVKTTTTTATTAATSGTVRVTSMRLPDFTKNNVMVYLDDMSVCYSRTASDIFVTKWGNKRLLEQSLIR